MAIPTHLRLEFVTPERAIAHDDVDEVELPGEDGYLRRAAGPRAAARGAARRARCGTARAARSTTRSSPAASPRSCRDRVSILAPVAERAEDIDLARAEAAKRRAEERLAKPVARTSTSSARASRCCAPSPASTGRAHARVRAADAPMMRISSAVASDPGLRRESNEDAVLRPRRPRPVPGRRRHGRPRGRRSRVAARRRGRSRRSSTTRATPTSTAPGRFRTTPTLSLDGNRLTAAFRLANRRLAAAMEADDTLRGMATTAAAVLIDEGHAGRRARRRQPRLPVARRPARCRSRRITRGSASRCAPACCRRPTRAAIPGATS